jgi:nucleoredoxin
MDALFESTPLSAKDGTTIKPESLADKVVGLYFSAHWCPPCKAFTPKAAATYEKVKAAGKPYEMVFVSSDKDEKAFDEYRAEMPWLALPFQHRELKNKLARKFKVSG